MMSRVLISWLLSFGLYHVLAQSCNIVDLPDSLKSANKYIVQEIKKQFIIHGIETAEERYFERFSILDNSAKKYAGIYVPYDKFFEIKSLKASVKDANGKLIETFKKSDFNDHSNFNLYAEFSDNRIKFLDLGKYPPPFQVEYEYVMNYKGTMFYPEHDFQYTKAPIISNEFIVQSPSSFPLRYRLQNMPEPKVEEINGFITYKWSASNAPIYQKVQFSKPINVVLPKVILSPGKFSFDGYSGDMSTWDGLANFQRSLFQSLQPLSESRKEYFKELVKEEGSEKDKVDKIYNYVQNNFRYVSIQLGIGGWKPFNPEYVDKVGYGDCKALTYYTLSALRAIGVDAYYTLVHADDVKPIFPDFPNRNFNHAMLCVPLSQDTIWLECTSQTKPAGYMGTFTSDRDVFVITDDSYKIVHVPTLDHQQNIQSRKAVVTFDNDLKFAKIDYQTKYSGLQSENENLDFILYDNQENKKKWLYKNLGIPDFEISSFSFESKKDIVPETTVKVELVARNITNLTGKRLFITPNLFNQNTFIPKEEATRQDDVYFSWSYTDIDSIEFIIPEIYYAELVPQPKVINYPFGEFETSYQILPGKIIYVRKRVNKQGSYPPHVFSDARNFYLEMNMADKSRIVLKNKT